MVLARARATTRRDLSRRPGRRHSATRKPALGVSDMRKLERRFFCVTLLRVSKAGFREQAMLGAKRALIVDDSKSARVFLARILEKYEIDVDNAENAEAAIEYLTSHRPDVIFMDHMMPGMDGFQAVQAIKNNPLTATIPIMMYTSQEGELYLGQARALGAVGVLPKQIKPTDVSKVLYQLHLLQDRRSPQQTSFRPVNVAPAEADQAAANDSGVVPKILTETVLREQFAELRRALVAGVDTQTERITAEVRALLLEAFPPAPPPVTETPPTPASRPPIQWGWIV